MAQIGSLFASLTLQSANFDSGIKRATRDVKQAEQEMGKSFGQMTTKGESTFRKLGAAAAGLGVGAGIGVLLTKIGQVNTEYQKLQGMLYTANGSQAAVAKTMGDLVKFAAQTPFSLNQVTAAYVKLKNLGLDPSTAALKSYGNTASAMGKDVQQMIEAVADASTGEFERLKEFGIKSKVEGDKVSFTFQGVTTTVKKNADEIQAYLLKIGNTQFAGAMDRQAQTLGGALSNLGDTLSQMAVKFGEAGFAPALEGAIRAINEGTGSVENLAVKLGYLTGQAIGSAVNGLMFLSQNLDQITIALELAAAVAAGRFAVAIGATAVTAVRGLIAANTAAIAGALMYARVAPVVGTATIALTGLGAAARGVVALFGGPWGVAIAALTGGLLLLANRASDSDVAIKKLGASNAEAANLLQQYHNQAVQTVAAQNQLDASTDGLTGRFKKGTTEAERFRQGLERLGITAQWAAFQAARALHTKALADYRAAKADAAEKDAAQSRASMGHAGEAARGQAYSARSTLALRNTALGEANETLRLATEGLNNSLNLSRAGGAPRVPTAPTAPTGSSGRSGSRRSPEDPLKAAKDMVASLQFQEQQLKRTNEEQEVYNNLKQAGVTLESDYGRKIADQTRANQSAEAVKKHKEAMDAQVKSLRQQTDELGKNERQIALLTLQREHDEAVTKGLTTANDELYKSLVNLTNGYFDAKEAQEAKTKAEQKGAEEAAAAIEKAHREQEWFGQDLADIGIRAFDGLIKGSLSFAESMKGILTDIGDLLLETLIYKPMRELAASALPQLISGALGSIGVTIPGLPGGTPAVKGMAKGGAVTAGQEVWVGEHGPERFVAPVNGRIIPHDANRGGGISIHVDARGSTNEAATRALVIEGIATAMPQIKEAAYAHTMSKAGRLRM